MMSADRQMLPEEYAQDSFHSYLKSSLTQAKIEKLLDPDVLASAEGDLIIKAHLRLAPPPLKDVPPTRPLPPTILPARLSLAPQHQHDLARIICGLAPISDGDGDGGGEGTSLRGIAADLRAISIEISQRRSFQNCYAADLQAALDARGDGSSLKVKALFVPPPLSDDSRFPSSPSSTFERTPSLSPLTPDSPAIEPQAQSSRSNSPDRTLSTEAFKQQSLRNLGRQPMWDEDFWSMWALQRMRQFNTNTWQSERKSVHLIIPFTVMGHQISRNVFYVGLAKLTADTTKRASAARAGSAFVLAQSGGNRTLDTTMFSSTQFRGPTTCACGVVQWFDKVGDVPDTNQTMRDRKWRNPSGGRTTYGTCPKAWCVMKEGGLLIALDDGDTACAAREAEAVCSQNHVQSVFKRDRVEKDKALRCQVDDLVALYTTGVRPTHVAGENPW
ncbi:hypothetical protein BV22DRAFT_1123056 [Leucogyrophana mollusca]|uniref:Uncharacterized protein n=1 Tax=Leucogyrophana mollusca TaxID=85980 RepID=A0ACB8B5F7_9AGAM|nr:hypothetical protein BV22DRAFT_1123056 [Leucogyrophana mollusca]